VSSYSSGYMVDKELRCLLLNEMSYDVCTGNLYWTKKSRKRNMEDPVGTKHSSGYLLFSTGVSGKVYSLRAHRFVWLKSYGVWPKHFVDHKNRDRSDNRLSNLREATDSENACNAVLASNNKSGYRGVSWSSCHRKWVARIGLGNKKHKFLGYYDCPKDAALSYDRASLEHHRHFGVRNFEG